jgi:hypothetical protein
MHRRWRFIVVAVVLVASGLASGCATRKDTCELPEYLARP